MKNKLKNIVNNLKLKRLNVFLLFLLLALVISIVAKLSNKVTQTLTIELVPSNLTDTDILIDNNSKFINVTVNSQGLNLIKYAFRDLKLNVDFSSLKKDGLNYIWSKDDNGYKVSELFDNSTNIQDISPNLISFAYDLQSIKKIPVFINESTQFSPGYNLIKPLECIPDSVLIIGSKAIVDNTFSIRTKKIELTSVKQNIDEFIELQFDENLKYSDSIIKIIGKVDRFTEGKLNIPVKVINIPKDLNVTIFPKVVPVLFYTNLTSYNSISVSDFIVECDFSSINQENNILFPRLVSYPKSILRASIQLGKLEYVITKK